LKVSVVDLGYNSLKLVSYEVKNDNSSFAAYDQESVPARLGEGLSQTGFLGTEPIRRAINGLKFFKEINELYGIRHCLPVATSAVREAANREQFVKQVLDETGLNLRVLSGKEEALFSYSGAVRALEENNILFFDIGGGSLELVYSDHSNDRKIFSLPLGGLRLSQLYMDREGAYKEKAYSRMQKRILELLPGRDELMLRDDTILVGVGGNLRALARWDQKLKDYPFNKIHNYVIKRESVESMTEELSNLSVNKIGEIDVIGRDRAQTLTAGSLVIESIMKKLGFRRLTVSTHGLRDGILCSFLDDPVGYHQGKLGRIPPKKIKSQIEKEILPSARDFLQKLQSFDLVGLREVEIVLFSLQWMLGDASSLRPEALFAVMMDEDSSLSHREQLLGALSIIELRKARSANWLYTRYRSLLKPNKDKMLERLGSLSRFLEIIARTDSRLRVTFSEGGSRISIQISSDTPEARFPNKILSDSISELGNELDRFIEYKVKWDQRRPVNSTEIVEEEGMETHESEKPFDS
jgi:exopolyphosphatase / guanosine-5'-triphosphate,3'-diphosphate pyrophosphatase